MSVPIAAQGHVGIRKEESFASGGAVVAYQPIISEDLVMNKQYFYGDRIMNTGQQVGARLMRHSMGGSITFPISPSNPQQWWECGIGNTASPYRYGRPLKSMVIHIDRVTGDVYTSGDMINSLEISSQAGGALQCVASVECKGFQSLTAGSPSYTSGDDPYLHNEAIFELDDTADSDITQFSVSINNNLLTDLYANSKERRDIPASKSQVTGSFTKLFSDVTARNKFLQELPTKVEAIYSRGSNQFAISLAKVKFDTLGEPLAGQADYIVETFNFTAYVDDASTEYALQLTIV